MQRLLQEATCLEASLQDILSNWNLHTSEPTTGQHYQLLSLSRE